MWRHVHVPGICSTRKHVKLKFTCSQGNLIISNGNKKNPYFHFGCNLCYFLVYLSYEVLDMKERPPQTKQLLDTSAEKFDEIVKIARERFAAGHEVAFIPLWGDPLRGRNFAGVWLEANGSRGFTGRVSGKLLGHHVRHGSEFSDQNLEEVIARSLLIWESYTYPQKP